MRGILHVLGRTGPGRYFGDIIAGVWTALVGMTVTGRQLLSPTVTQQYPEEKWEVPPGFRGKLFNNIDDCIVCNQCANVCPTECFTIVGEKLPKGTSLGDTTDGHTKRIGLKQFDIELNHCLYCGYCTEVCPTECLIMTPEYEYATYDRTEFLQKFVAPEDERKLAERIPELEKEAAEIERKKEEAKKAAEAKKGETKPPEGGDGETKDA